MGRGVSGSTRLIMALFIGGILLVLVLGGALLVSDTSLTGLLTAPGYETQPPEHASIAPSVQDRFEAEDTTALLVKFDSSHPETPGGGVDVAKLKQEREQAQNDFSRFADETTGVSVDRSFWLGNMARITVDTEAVTPTDLARVQGVKRVSLDSVVTVMADTGPASPGTTVQPAGGSGGIDATWGVDRVNATTVWQEFGDRGNGTRVAVLDTGVNVSHPDITLYTDDPGNDTYPGGWAEFDDAGNKVVGSEPHDTDGHGTHVSGTVAGGNSSGDYIGVAPDADLMHGLVLPDGSGYTGQVIAGMEWAVEHNASIISMSLGSQNYVPDYIDAIQDAENAGVTVISAMGNDGADTSASPGNVYNGTGVGASGTGDGIAWFSSGEAINTEDAWGSDAPSSWPDTYVVPDIAAPGTFILSSNISGGWSEKHGTSMATPHVAGAAAVLQSGSAQHLSPDTIEEALERTAWKPDNDTWEDSISDWEDATGDTWDEPKSVQDPRYGHGIIDLYAAYTALKLNRDRIHTCETVHGTGDWLLNTSVDDAGTCLTFNGTHTLDGESHAVGGGISVVNGSTAVHNVTVQDAETGIHVDENASVNLSHVTFTGNTWDVYGQGYVNTTTVSLSGQDLSFTGSAFNLSTGAAIALPDDQVNTSRFLNLSALDSSAWADIEVVYTSDMLVNESNITLWRHNGTDWSTVNDTVRNDTRGTVRANLSTFSTVVAAGNEIAPANVTVNITALPDRKVAGQQWNVTVNATNTGEVTAVQNVTAETLNASDRNTVTLEPGIHTLLNLTLYHDATGNITVNASSHNHTTMENITIIDTPNITLAAPVDGEIRDYRNATTMLNTSFTAEEPVNASTVLNGSTINTTETDTAGQNWMNTSQSLDPGTYTWNVSLTGLETGYETVSQTNTFTLEESPMLQAVTPTDGAVFSPDESVTYNVTIDSVASGTVMLVENGETLEEYDHPAGNASYNLTVERSTGTYTWNATFYSGTGNSFTTETRLFKVEDEDDDGPTTTTTAGPTRQHTETEDELNETDSVADPQITESANSTHIDSIYLEPGDRLHHGFERFTPLSTITVTAEESLENASILLNRTFTRSIPVTGGEHIAVYEGVTVETEASVTTAFTFTINGSWFVQHGVHPANVSVYRFTGGDWVQADTELRDRDPYRYGANTTPSTVMVGGTHTPVSAADGEQCMEFPGTYGLEDTWDVVESCELWRQKSRLEEQLADKQAQELSSDETDVIAEAETYLEQGDLERAESLLEELDADPVNDREPADTLLFVLLVIVLTGLVLLYRQMRRKQEIEAWQA